MKENGLISEMWMEGYLTGRFDIDVLETLFSLARTEYMREGHCDSPFMKKLTEFFNFMAYELAGNNFVWSEYNISAWNAFCYLETAASPAGGRVVFSLENDGRMPEGMEEAGLGMGVPTGTIPYKMWAIVNEHNERINNILKCYKANRLGKPLDKQ